MVRKQTKYLDTVAYLVKSHLKCDRKMTRAFLCSSEDDGVIRLLEVSESVPPMEEILPFDFDAAPNDNIPYPHRGYRYHTSLYHGLINRLLPCQLYLTSFDLF